MKEVIELHFLGDKLYVPLSLKESPEYKFFMLSIESMCAPESYRAKYHLLISELEKLMEPNSIRLLRMAAVAAYNHFDRDRAMRGIGLYEKCERCNNNIGRTDYDTTGNYIVCYCDDCKENINEG